MIPAGLLDELYNTGMRNGALSSSDYSSVAKLFVQHTVDDVFSAPKIQSILSFLNDKSSVIVKLFNNYKDSLVRLSVFYLDDAEAHFNKQHKHIFFIPFFYARKSIRSDWESHPLYVAPEALRLMDDCLKAAYVLFKEAYRQLYEKDSYYQLWGDLISALLSIGCVNKQGVLLISLFNPIRMMYLYHHQGLYATNGKKKNESKNNIKNDSYRCKNYESLISNIVRNRYGYTPDDDVFVYDGKPYFLDFSYSDQLSWIAFDSSITSSRTIQNAYFIANKINRHYQGFYRDDKKAFPVALIGDVSAVSLIMMLRRVLRNIDKPNLSADGKLKLKLDVYGSMLSQNAFSRIAKDCRAKIYEFKELPKEFAKITVTGVNQYCIEYLDYGIVDLTVKEYSDELFTSFELTRIAADNRLLFVVDALALYEDGAFGVQPAYETQGLTNKLAQRPYGYDKEYLREEMQIGGALKHSAFFELLSRLNLCSAAQASGSFVTRNPLKLDVNTLRIIELVCKKTDSPFEAFIYACVPENYDFALASNSALETRSEITPYPENMKLLRYISNGLRKRGASAKPVNDNNPSQYIIRASKALQIIDPKESYYNYKKLAAFLFKPFIKACDANPVFAEAYKEKFFPNHIMLDLNALSKQLAMDLADRKYSILDDVLRDLRFVVREPNDMEPRFSLRPVFANLKESWNDDGSHKRWAMNLNGDCIPEYARIIAGYTLGMLAQYFLRSKQSEKRLLPIYNELYRTIMISCISKDSDILTYYEYLRQDNIVYVNYEAYFGVLIKSKNEFNDILTERLKDEKDIACHVINLLEACRKAKGFLNSNHRNLWAYKLLGNSEDLYYQHWMLKAIYPDEDKLKQATMFYALNKNILQNVNL